MSVFDQVTGAADSSSVDFARWSRSAAEVAAELAGSAVERNEQDRLPVAEVALLRDAGLLPVPAPRAYGGGGASWREAMRLVRIVAQGDGSIGQLLGYHYFHIQRALLATAGGATERLPKAAAGGSFLAALVNPFDPDVRISRDGEGYVLNGRKTFSTGAAVADLLLVRSEFGPGTGREGHKADVVLPADAEGVVFVDDWHNFGQRLTASGTTEVHDVRVEPDQISPSQAPDAGSAPIATLAVPVIQSMFTSFYVGIAQGAFQSALAYTREQSRPWFTSGVQRAVDDPHIQERYGALAVKLESAVALTDRALAVLQAALDAGEALTAQQRGEVAIAVYHAKAHATEVALEITTKVIELTGARSTKTKFGFDLYWRNARVHTVHDPVYYKLTEIGQFLLQDQVPNPTLYS